MLEFKKQIRNSQHLMTTLRIYGEVWFDKYEKRPATLREITLAQFESKYKKSDQLRNVLRIIRYRNYDKDKDSVNINEKWSLYIFLFKVNKMIFWLILNLMNYIEIIKG